MKRIAIDSETTLFANAFAQSIERLCKFDERHKSPAGRQRRNLAQVQNEAVVRNKFRSALRSHLLEPVLVVESAQNGNASDRVIVRNTVTMLVVWYECRQPRRDSRAQTHVRSRRVEMSNPGLQHIPEVPLMERN